MNFTSKVSFQLLKVVFLTGEGLADKTQKLDSQINMFLHLEVRHSRFCQLHLILSLFMNSPISIL